MAAIKCIPVLLLLTSILVWACDSRPYSITRAAVVNTTQTKSQVFDFIANTDYWESSQYGTLCGPGSSELYSDYVKAVVATVQFSHNFPVVVDVSCGDLPWQLDAIDIARRTLSWRNPDVFAFIALDVSMVMLGRAQQKAAGEPNIFFDQIDIVTDRLHVDGGLLICRDTLQHLPLVDGIAALRNLANSGADMLLLGGYNYNHINNVNIATGGYYLFNPTQPPFSIGPQQGLIKMEKEDTLLFNGAEKFLFFIDLNLLRESDLYRM